MTRWGLRPLARHQVHTQVRLRLIRSTNPDVKDIGLKLERLGMNRSAASYDLRPLPLFATAADAQNDVNRSAAALALLDAIDADPARRAAAIASLTP
jgi:hypothetical protein